MNAVAKTEKVYAYVTCDRQLLVFRQPANPEAGIQVPGGSIRTGESPERAVLRELSEETGLRDFGQAVLLGIAEYDMRDFGRNEIQRRHFYLVPFQGSRSARWTHFETSGGTISPIEFEFFWVLPHRAARMLIAGHGALLGALPRTA
jgi:8-oxo-dGTP pyrophosphatase MutT (NUDIX family)